VDAKKGCGDDDRIDYIFGSCLLGFVMMLWRQMV
jgi:hypothetical protein